MDKMIISSTLPLAALTSIIPLVAGADLFWVNQLRDALAVSAQSAANLVYQFSFGLFSFLPSVTATLVSKHFANDDIDETQNVICQSLVFAVTLSTIAASVMFLHPTKFLGSVLKGTL
jgi:Na+-driven multidrug efflux pump